jgi:hypothetical protein
MIANKEFKKCFKEEEKIGKQNKPQLLKQII